MLTNEEKAQKYTDLIEKRRAYQRDYYQRNLEAKREQGYLCHQQLLRARDGRGGVNGRQHALLADLLSVELDGLAAAADLVDEG